jgi:hypothetical protein
MLWSGRRDFTKYYYFSLGITHIHISDILKKLSFSRSRTYIIYRDTMRNEDAKATMVIIYIIISSNIQHQCFETYKILTSGVMVLRTQTFMPNYSIHRTENVTVNVSRYIWNVNITYLDTFINHVSRYVTVSDHEHIHICLLLALVYIV